MRVGRVAKEIVRAPAGVPIVPGLAQVMRLVDVGRRPGALNEENQKNQPDFERQADQREDRSQGGRVQNIVGMTVRRTLHRDAQTSLHATRNDQSRPLAWASPAPYIRPGIDSFSLSGAP